MPPGGARAALLGLVDLLVESLTHLLSELVDLLVESLSHLLSVLVDLLRDGFLGVITRLGTSCTYALYVKDNHSLVASDFYVEQADNIFSLEGSPDDPEGRITLQDPKLDMSKMKDGKENIAFNISGYHGQIIVGPAQFYSQPKLMRLYQTGTLPLEILFWANCFVNTSLQAQKTESARLSMVGGIGVTAELNEVQVDETMSPDSLTRISTALDDLRHLGELDLKFNHN